MEDFAVAAGKRREQKGFRIAWHLLTGSRWFIGCCVASCDSLSESLDVFKPVQ